MPKISDLNYLDKPLTVVKWVWKCLYTSLVPLCLGQGQVLCFEYSNLGDIGILENKKRYASFPGT
jgi:hypothetical protein